LAALFTVGPLDLLMLLDENVMAGMILIIVIMRPFNDKGSRRVLVHYLIG
jgi:hypothetical protein